MARYSYILFVYFSLCFTNVKKIYRNIIQLSNFLWKAIFFRVRHSFHPGGGHISLTCHIIEFVRSDWLRSANLINIMIELWLNYLVKGAIRKIVCFLRGCFFFHVLRKPVPLGFRIYTILGDMVAFV